MSDTHFGHRNIVQGVSSWDDKSGCRKFKTIDEMNQNIVKLINTTVKEDDILYHLGDWSFGGSDNIWNFRKQINCKNIHLILGNHDEIIEKDLRLNNVYIEQGYKQLYDKSMILTPHDRMYFASSKDLFTSIRHYVEIPHPFKKKEKIVLMHYPIEEWNGKHKGWIHLHGHSHEALPLISGTNRINISNTLKIFSMDDIIKIIK